MSTIEYVIGWRYIRSKKRRFISVVSLISIFGIAVGVTVIITVLSVMNGFREEIRDRMLDILSHNTVIGFEGHLEDWRPLKEKLEKEDSVVAAAPFIESQAVLLHQGRVSGTHMRGVLPALETETSAIEKRMVDGSLATLVPGEYNVILGSALADYLRIAPGERITAMTPQGTRTPAGMLPRVRRLHVSGVFKSGLSQFDRYIAMVHLDDARRLARIPEGRVSGLHLRVRDLFESPAISRALQARLGMDYWVSDWTKSHRSFFRALEMEKLLLLVIMMLIVVVAMFNIVSMLVMVVMEKRGDIAILRTIGILPGQVMKIFITQGCLIGALGNALGVLGGIALATHIEDLIIAIETATGFKFLSPDVYPITKVPSQLLAGDVLVVAALTFTLTALATIYPAWRAARIQPAEVLKAA